jgi:hypothetical protein
VNLLGLISLQLLLPKSCRAIIDSNDEARIDFEMSFLSSSIQEEDVSREGSDDEPGMYLLYLWLLANSHFSSGEYNFNIE